MWKLRSETRGRNYRTEIEISVNTAVEREKERENDRERDWEETGGKSLLDVHCV